MAYEYKVVKLNTEVHKKVFMVATANTRTVPAQIEHWASHDSGVDLEGFRDVIDGIKQDIGFRTDQQVIDFILAGRRSID